MSAAHRSLIYGVFVLIIALNIFAWMQLRHVRSHWVNVPPAPAQGSMMAFMPGDGQFSYRIMALMLQNLGSVGGEDAPLRDYNYDHLAEWFWLGDRLDPQSNFMPMLAAFYFGAVIGAPEKLPPLAEFLHHAGSNTTGEKWRWLAQAVYMEQFEIKDMDKAYKWAQELAAFDRPDMPMWTKQMPAFILNDEGNKQAAYDIMVEILKSDAKKMDPNEINFMKDYICTRTLDEAAANTNPLCQDQNTKH